MAEKLMLDDGILELDINGRGLLRFNPSDFNLYQRFCALVRSLPKMEERYRQQVEIPTETTDKIELAGVVLDNAMAIDKEIKESLAKIFGNGNDFDKLLDGVNLMAFGKNGERIITNLLSILMPYFEEGANRHMKDAARQAVDEAKIERAKRGVTK